MNFQKNCFKPAVPFNAQSLVRRDYDFAEFNNQDIQIYQCQYSGLQNDIGSWQIINSQSTIPQIYIIKRLEKIKIEDLYSTFNSFTQALLIQIITKQNHCIIPLINSFKKEHQSDKIRTLLNELSLKLNEEIKEQRKTLVQKIFKELQRWFIGRIFQDNSKQPKAEEIVQSIFQSVEFIENQQLPFKFPDSQEYQKYTKQFNEHFGIINKQFKQIQGEFKNLIDELYFELCQQSMYSVKKINLRSCRNESQRIQNIIPQLDELNDYCLDGSFLSKRNQDYIVKDIFSTKNRATIFIVYTQTMAYILFLLFQAPQVKVVKQLELIDIQQAVYYFDYILDHLFIFNHKEKYVQQIIITSGGIVQNDLLYCSQLDNLGNPFLVDQVAYINTCKQFIVLSKNNKIYTQSETEQSFRVFKCLQEIEQKVIKTEFSPSTNPTQQYKQLLTCPSGKYFYLANFHCCDRYDFHGKKLQTIPINGLVKIVSDSSDVIIFDQLDELQNQRQKQVLLIQSTRFQQRQQQECQILGNPALDIVKGSFIKFGPNADFLYQNKQRNIQLCIKENEQGIMENYYKKLNVLNYANLNIKENQFSQCDKNQIMDIIFSRVPLQICTIENGTLIPLNDGFRQLSLNQKSISIDCKVKKLHLGFLEDYLLAEEKKIFVVGIIGRQSSGKSYLLNRVFGTRFSVSSARCTDGVWGSLAMVNNQKFLILDCEGLFNGSRTEKEEVKMLAFITAISDITILNQDASFSRHQNELLNNLVEASNQLNDEKLFQGFLYMIIRDVSSTDNLGLEKEQMRNLDRLRKPNSQDIVFLNKLFKNTLSVEKLVNNENSEFFDEQIKQVRNFLIQKSTESIRWKNGKELIQMVKIVLCQLELSDTKNAGLIAYEIRLEQIYQESKEQWYKFSLDQQQQGEELKLNQRSYQFEMDDLEYLKQNHTLLKSLYNDLQLKDNVNDHKSNLEEAKNQLKKLMDQRKKLINKKTQSELANINSREVQAKIELENSKLEDFFKIQFNRYQYCQSKCNECFLTCKYFNNHSEHFDQLKKKFEIEITRLEQEKNNSSIKNQIEEIKERNSLISITQSIEEIENKLFLLSNLIQLSTKHEEKQDQMNKVQKFNFFRAQRVQQNGSKMEIENQNMQITFDINFISQKQKNTKNELQNQLGKLNKIINEKEEIEMKCLELENQCNQIGLKTERYQVEICQYQQVSKQLLSEITIIENEIRSLGVDVNEDEKNQHSNKIRDRNQKLSDLRDELKFLQQSYNENLRLKEQYTNMATQEFLQLYQQKSDKKKELEAKLTQTINKKIDLNKNKAQIYQMNEELTELSQFKYKNKSKIENIKQELSQPKFQNIENQIEQCCNEESQLKEQIDSMYFSKIDFFDLCLVEQGRQNQQIDQTNIKQEFLLKIQLETTEQENDIIRFLQEIEIVNQEILQSQLVVDRQNKLINLLNEKQIKNGKKDELGKQIIDVTEKYNTLLETLEKKKQELNILKQYETDFINQQQLIEQSIEQAKIDLNDLKILEEKLIKIQTLEIEIQKFETLLKDWKGKEYYANLTLKNLEQEYQIMEKKMLDLQIQQQNKKKNLEIFEKVERSCARLETLKQNLQELADLNLNVHSCLRENHKCDQACKVCPSKTCDNKAGHNEQQYHLCSLKNHKCNIKCDIIQCQVKCNLELNHAGLHNCTNDHLCAEKCQYCSKKCSVDRTTEHQNHICEEIYCKENCMLCERRCKKAHEHSQYCNSQCEKQHTHSQEQQNHFCGDQHECRELCQEKGICQITYTQVEIMWQSRFPYIKYIPQSNQKKKCCKSIKPDQLNHDQIHSCMVETEKQFHLCDQKCPECNKICDLKYGHPGHHSSQIHINKENQIFTAKQGEEFNLIIQDQDNNVVRQYQIGEQSTPETCDQSCKRRGKSHYHLIECKGESQCLEKQYGIRAKHSKEKYEGFQNLNFDEVLCIDYWDYKGWAHPIPNETQNIGQCNYYCPLCKKINGEYQFCCLKAWHCQDNTVSKHKFPCSSTHKGNLIQGINIAFVIDSTGSMSEYIQNCKEVIISIMQKIKQNNKIEMKFAIVSYKDHSNPYDEFQNVVNICQFTSYTVAIGFLNSLSAEGGDDEPEAVLDGLHASSELNWNDNYQNLLYLIADAPPHGKKYHNFGDSFPNGCPCNKTQSQIFQNMRNKKIQVKIMKLNQKIEGMITQFKEDYPDLMVITPQDDQNITFQNVIVEDVCEYLKHNEITYQMLDAVI